jgi:hypothetical protein
MPSYALNNITAPDKYGKTSTLDPLPVLDHINIDVTNQAIYWSIKQTNQLTTDLSGAWQPEVFMAPGSRSISRHGVVGIRIRAAVAAANLPAGSTQAQVTVEAVES